MKGKTLLPWLAALLLAVPALPAQLAAAKGEYHYDFEKTMKPWQAGSFLVSGGSKAGKVTGDNGCTDGGNNYAAMTFTPAKIAEGDVPVPGPQQSAVWIGAAFPLRGYETVHVEWASLASKSCEGCTPIVYVGTQAPTTVGQFTALKQSKPESDPFQLGDWGNLQYSTKVKGDGLVYVALGVRVPASHITEGTPKSQLRTAGVDCVSVLIYPVP